MAAGRYSNIVELSEDLNYLKEIPSDSSIESTVHRAAEPTIGPLRTLRGSTGSQRGCTVVPIPGGAIGGHGGDLRAPGRPEGLRPWARGQIRDLLRTADTGGDTR